MGRPQLNPERTCAGNKYLEYREGRVVDPNPDPIRPDEVFFRFPHRRVHGILMHGGAHNPGFKNIYTGECTRVRHHNKETGRERKSEDFLGDNPDYGYCYTWMDHIKLGRVKCGREMCIKSQGCGEHGRDAAEAYRLAAAGKPIQGHMFVDPQVLEAQKRIEEELLIAEEAKSNENEKLEAELREADEKGIPRWELYQRVKKIREEQWKKDGKPNRRTYDPRKATPAAAVASTSTAPELVPEDFEEPLERDAKTTGGQKNGNAKTKAPRLMARFNKQQSGSKKKKN